MLTARQGDLPSAGSFGGWQSEGTPTPTLLSWGFSPATVSARIFPGGTARISIAKLFFLWKENEQH